MKICFQLAAAVFVSIPSIVFTQDYQKGLAALEVSDHAKALQKWKPISSDNSYRLSVGTEIAPAEPDDDLTEFYGARAGQITFMGGGSFVEAYFGIDARQFPVSTVVSGGNVTPTADATVWRSGIVTDADRVAFRVDGGFDVLSKFHVIVEGVPVFGNEPASVSAGRRYLVVEMGAGIHEVILQSSGDGRFIGVSLPTGATILPITRKRAIAFGDSFTMGTGADTGRDTWANILGDKLNISDMWASGAGGTGYTADNGGTGFALQDRVGADMDRFLAEDTDHEFVLIALGVNDDSGNIRMPAASALATIRRKTTAPIFVLGPWDLAAPEKPTAGYYKKVSQIEAAVATQDNVYFIDVEGIVFERIADNVHPDTNGHKRLGLTIADLIEDELSVAQSNANTGGIEYVVGGK